MPLMSCPKEVPIAHTIKSAVENLLVNFEMRDTPLVELEVLKDPLIRVNFSFKCFLFLRLKPGSWQLVWE
jgi:hypothetical protein